MSTQRSTARHRPVGRLVWIVATALLVAACSSPSASPTGGGGGDGVITISGTTFSPSSITVAFGDPIEFHNDGSPNHRIVQGENGVEVADPAFAPLELGSGDRSQQLSFSPGTYHITCTIHRSMNMTITVTE